MSRLILTALALLSFAAAIVPASAAEVERRRPRPVIVIRG
jgi:hypothetical protein